MPGLPSHGETPVSVADASVLDLLAMVDWFDPEDC